MDVDALKRAAEGRWVEIISRVGGISADLLDGRNHPCPKCGGDDRFRFISEERGALFCNQCFNKENGDGIAAIMWLTDATFPATLKRIAEYLGMEPEKPSSRRRGTKAAGKPTAKRGRQRKEGIRRPKESLTAQVGGWEDGFPKVFGTILRSWCKAKPPITVKAAKDFGVRVVLWPNHGRKGRYAVAFAGRNPQCGEEIHAIELFRPDGKPFPPMHKGYGDNQREILPERKTRHLRSSVECWFWPGTVKSLLNSTAFVWCEGLPDALALWSHGLPRGWIAISNACGAGSTPQDFTFMAGKDVCVIGDADSPGMTGRDRHAELALRAGARRVRVADLPFEVTESHGKDLRDYFLDGHTGEELIAKIRNAPNLCCSDLGIAPVAARGDAEPEASAAKDLDGEANQGDGEAAKPIQLPKPKEAEDDPHLLARYFHYYCRSQGIGEELLFWKGMFYAWRGSCFHAFTDQELQPLLTAYIKEIFDERNIEKLMEQEEERRAGNSPENERPSEARKVSRPIVFDAMNALKSMRLLPTGLEPPCWIDGTTEVWPAEELLVASNGIFHLPSLLDGNAECIEPNPKLFTLHALDYPLDSAAVAPNWYEFLASVFGDDTEARETLQEWFGYLLLPENKFQKILLIIGPPRSGKGTISQAMADLVGKGQHARPSLALLGTQFGLWPLVGKRLAIVGDARLSNRIDQALSLERLLGISGGDEQNIDRKNLPILSAHRLETRFVICANEVPGFIDNTGALISRFVAIELRKSFLGRENSNLRDLLRAERSGILRWALVGLQRLLLRGAFEQPESGKALLAKTLREFAPVTAFVDDLCELGDNYVIPKSVLFERWQTWATSENTAVGNKAQFGKALHAAFPMVGDFRGTIDGRRAWCYTGIRLRATAG